MNKDKMEKSYCTAIVLAAGSGKRMGTTTHKQYLLMGGHPVLFYSLRTFQESEFIDEGIIERAYECVCKSDACIAGMPVKDTIKIVNERQRVESTPDRATLWAIQTPQVFLADLLLKAYGKLMKQNWIQVTDDAMVVEKMLNHEVQVFTGKYENIKITTPEDLVIAKAFLDK